MTQNRTTLWVKKETHRELKERKGDAETFDEQLRKHILDEE